MRETHTLLNLIFVEFYTPRASVHVRLKNRTDPSLSQYYVNWLMNFCGWIFLSDNCSCLRVGLYCVQCRWEFCRGTVKPFVTT